MSDFARNDLHDAIPVHAIHPQHCPCTRCDPRRPGDSRLLYALRALFAPLLR